MAYEKAFLKISFLFLIGGTAEIAQTSFDASTVGAGTFDAEAALAGFDTGAAVALSDALLDVLDNSAIWWASYSDLIGVKCAAVGTDGHYLADPLTEPGTTQSGDNEGVPPQNSVVVSLRSSEHLGNANYGRMYLPHTGAPLETGTPRISQANAATLATAMAGMVGAWNTELATWPGDPLVVIASQKGAGLNKPVLQVGCGRVVDTQRRRRNQLDEDTQLDTV
jgi:hypothetical protein